METEHPVQTESALQAIEHEVHTGRGWVSRGRLPGGGGPDLLPKFGVCGEQGGSPAVGGKWQPGLGNTESTVEFAKSWCGGGEDLQRCC